MVKKLANDLLCIIHYTTIIDNVVLILYISNMVLSNKIKEALMERQTYTIRECAKILGVGVSVMYESARRGELPVLKFGRRLVVPKYAFDRMLQDPEAQIPRYSSSK